MLIGVSVEKLVSVKVIQELNLIFLAFWMHRCMWIGHTHSYEQILCKSVAINSDREVKFDRDDSWSIGC